MVEIQNVSKSYSQGDKKIEVLKDLNMQVAKGKVAAVIGPSGSGKSTLLSLLSGIDSPDSGDIKLNNTSLNSLTEAKRVRFRGENIGMIFQQFHLVPHLTAKENITLPMSINGRKVVDKEVKEILAHVGLENRGDHLPYQLSGGEAQRVAMARALIMRPAIILADEPSGSLDVETGDRVMKLFFDLLREAGSTAVLVTHNLELAHQCDQVFKLDKGSV